MTRINIDMDMIERMERDLAEKAANAFKAAGVDSTVHGVYSLDDLEDKLENQLQRKIGVGVAYHQAKPTEFDTNPRGSPAPGQSRAVRMVSYEFLVVLAVPTQKDCPERYNATRLLTVLRQRIHGSMVAGDVSARPWGFLKEAPDIGASTETLIFYSQVWHVAMPLIGTPTH